MGSKGTGTMFELWRRNCNIYNAWKNIILAGIVKLKKIKGHIYKANHYSFVDRELEWFFFVWCTDYLCFRRVTVQTLYIYVESKRWSTMVAKTYSGYFRSWKNSSNVDRSFWQYSYGGKHAPRKMHRGIWKYLSILADLSYSKSDRNFQDSFLIVFKKDNLLVENPSRTVYPQIQFMIVHPKRILDSETLRRYNAITVFYIKQELELFHHYVIALSNKLWVPNGYRNVQIFETLRIRIIQICSLNILAVKSFSDF